MKPFQQCSHGTAADSAPELQHKRSMLPGLVRDLDALPLELSQDVLGRLSVSSLSSRGLPSQVFDGYSVAAQ